MKYFLEKEDAFSYIKENYESLGLHGIFFLVEPLDAGDEKRYWVSQLHSEVTARMSSLVKYSEPELEEKRYRLWEFISMVQWEDGLKNAHYLYRDYQLAFPNENLPLMKKEKKLSTFTNISFIIVN